MQSYHKRSNVQTTFQMIKTKFGSALRSKTNAFLVLMLLLAPYVSSQTTIVAVRSSGEVVLAADSKARPAKEEIEGSVVMCKVFTCGEFYVSFAGVTTRPGGSFDPFAYLPQPCQTPGDAHTRFAAIEKAVLPKYTQVLERLRSEDPVRYALAGRTEKLSLVFIMIGIESGVPFIMSTGYPQPTNSTGPVIVHPVPQFFIGPVPPGVSQYKFAGSYNEIDALMKTRNPFGELGLVRGAEFLVNYMIAAQPDDVGSPIDIVRRTKNGTEWICQKPSCDKEGKGKPCPSPTVQLESTPAKPTQGFPLPKNSPPIGMIVFALVVSAGLVCFFVFRNRR